MAKVDGSATAVRLTKDDGAPSKYPDLAIGAGGRMALSWQDERDGNVEVYLLTGVLGDLRGEIDGRSRRVTNTPGETIGAYLAWNGDRLGLSWSDKTSGQHEVYFESFDATGMPREAARHLTGNTTWSLVPRDSSTRRRLCPGLERVPTRVRRGSQRRVGSLLPSGSVAARV